MPLVPTPILGIGVGGASLRGVAILMQVQDITEVTRHLSCHSGPAYMQEKTGEYGIIEHDSFPFFKT